MVMMGGWGTPHIPYDPCPRIARIPCIHLITPSPHHTNLHTHTTRYGPRRGWAALRGAFATERPHDLWVLDNYPHSCSATGPRFPNREQVA